MAIVEDNAHGLFGKYEGRYLGTSGCLATVAILSLGLLMVARG